jgi:phytoene dehydrogenase-like protein
MQRWQRPDNMKALRGFLGSVNSYLSFYPQLDIVSAPLARATGKGVPTWSDKLEEAFNRTKSVIMNVSTVSLPTPHDLFIPETDASGYGIGAVLLHCEEGRKG